MTTPGNREVRRAFLALVLVFGCRTEQTRPETGSETHFLSFCAGADTCGDTLDCVCGVCTASCSETTDCKKLSTSAECAAVEFGASGLVCDDALNQTVCEVACNDTADCASLSASHRCDRGVCRQLPLNCITGGVAGSDVVLLGDQFIAETRELTTGLEALARETGALGSDEEYRDYSDALITPFGGPNDLAAQYAAARAEGTPHLVILDVGGPNALLTCPEPLAADCPALVEAVSGTEALLDQMATDSVEVVVDFFYPDPVDATLQAKFDVLRPLLQQVCDASPLRCHFIDLRPTFAGHEEYLQSAGILPTADGSAVTAEVIFSVMQQHCLAQ